jgi:hypothetical protein
MSRTTKERRAGALTRLAPPPTVRSSARCYRTASGCTVIVDQEPARENRSGLILPERALLLWHLSIAHAHRYPTWDEIADVRYELVPHDVTMAMLLPPPDQYVNANEHCFHLWEIDDPRGASDGR